MDTLEVLSSLQVLQYQRLSQMADGAILLTVSRGDWFHLVATLHGTKQSPWVRPVTVEGQRGVEIRVGAHFGCVVLFAEEDLRDLPLHPRELFISRLATPPLVDGLYLAVPLEGVEL